MPKGRYEIMLRHMPRVGIARPRHDAAHLHHPGQSRLCVAKPTWRRSSASAWRCSRSPPRCSPTRRSPKASPTACSRTAATSGRTPIRTAPACCRSCSRTASATSATSTTCSTCRCTSCSATADISTPPGQSFRDFLEGRAAGAARRDADARATGPTTSRPPFPKCGSRPSSRCAAPMAGRGTGSARCRRLWVGLLYDDAALDAAWDLVKHWSMEEREALRDAVPRLGARCAAAGRRQAARPRRRGGRRSPPPGLVARGRAQQGGDSEAGFLEPLAGDRRQRQGPGAAPARQVPRRVGRRHHAGLRRVASSSTLPAGRSARYGP